LLHIKRADYVMPDYRMTVRCLHWVLYDFALKEAGEAKWPSWAYAYADSIDPLKNGNLQRVNYDD